MNVNRPALRKVGAPLAIAALSAVAVAPLVGSPSGVQAQPAPTSVAPSPSSSTSSTRIVTTTTARLHCCLSVEFFPTTELTDGSVVDVTLRANGTAILRNPVPIQICKTESGQCATEAPSPAADATINFAPPSAQGTFTVPFRIGTGTFRLTSSSGTPYSFACGPGEPCYLRVDTGSQFGSVPIVRSTRLTYAGTPPTTTTSSTTSRPADPLCAYRDRIPARLWAVLVRLLGITC